MKRILPPFILLFYHLLATEGSTVLPVGALKSPIRSWKYHSHKEMTDFLNNLTKVYPDQSRLYSIGKSVLQKELWVLEISNAPRTSVGVPNVKLIGNIHGNEPLGKEIILLLAEYILSQYQSNKMIQWLMNTTKIHLLPSANPDGFTKASVHCGELSGSRNNILDVDLNTNFPDIFEIKMIPRQDETKAIMKWLQDIPFILSGSLHSSALVVTYPYDRKAQNITEGPSLTPDDDTFKYIASSYASSHPHMHKDSQCPHIKKKFKNGIINGGEWLSKKGTMQDYNYIIHACMEFSLVLSCCRYPKSEELCRYWEENRETLIHFINQAHMGVQGLTLNSISNRTIPNVQLRIVGREITFNSSKNGEYWRILLPGKYKIKVSMTGYKTRIMSFEVKRNGNFKFQMTWLNIPLTPCPINNSKIINNINCGNVTLEEKVGKETDEPTQIRVNKTESYIDMHIKLPSLYNAKAHDLGQFHEVKLIASSNIIYNINLSVITIIISIVLSFTFI